MELPKAFLEYIGQYPQLRVLAESLNTEPQASIRLNPQKDGSHKSPIQMGSQQLPRLETQDAGAGAKKALEDAVPWCEWGRYLPARAAFTFDPALHQGRYYVQDASSMAVYAAVKELAQKLDGNDGLRLLDTCAAPGGKTTAAISALPEDALVVANEYDYKRANILAENVAKWGSGNAIVARGDTSKLRALGPYFDIVLVDAPCSGEGMMRKDEQAVKQWSMQLVEQCSQLQREILANAWEALKPGGYLVYSTCTFNRLEDEENAQWLADELGAEPVELDSLKQHIGNEGNCIESGVETEMPCYRFLPGKTRGEGLFLCAVQKPKNGTSSKKPLSSKIKKSVVQELQPKEKQCVGQWIKADEYKLCKTGENIWAVPKKWADDANKLANMLDVLALGTKVATIAGKDVVPEHELAMCQALNVDSFPQVEVDYSQAISYLQRNAINIEVERGFVLLTYKHYPLGFVKNVGNRANNMYPKSWRILSNPPQNSADTGLLPN